MAIHGAAGSTSRFSAWRPGAFAAALAVLGALTAAAVASMLWPDVEDRRDAVVQFDPGGPVAQPFQLFDLDGWLVRQPDGSVRAFSAAEARTACGIFFVSRNDRYFGLTGAARRGEQGFFTDHCWGSTWTLEGAITFGPSWRGMDEFEVRQSTGGRVSLDLSRVRLGMCARGAEYLDCSLPGHARYRRPRAGHAWSFW
ncbi:MAG: hypothetical protein U0446_08730 [Dehalococcoidia bacterium]